MRRALKIGGIGCGGLIGLVILISVLVAVFGGKSKPSAAQTTTTTTAATTPKRTTSCLHVSVTALKAIASGLNNGIKLTTSGASAVKIAKGLYAVSVRLLGPGMSVGGPSYATWITDSITSPVIVQSGEPFATQFSQWGNSPYYGAAEPAVVASQGCVAGG